MRLDRRLRNIRPPRTRIADTSRERRLRHVIRGAQYSPSLEQWIGFLFDGTNLTMFEPRTNRDRALADAHAHYDRIFHEEKPARRWSRAS